MNQYVDNYFSRYNLLKLVLDPAEPRRVLRHVYCDGKFLTAASGYRLTAISNDDFKLERGFYDLAFTGRGRSRVPTFTRVANPGTYPEWQRMIPQSEPAMRLKFYPCDEMQYGLATQIFTIQLALASRKSGPELINPDFLKDMGQSGLALVAEIYDSKACPVVFRSMTTPDKLLHLIMPLRVDIGGDLRAVMARAKSNL